MSFTVQDGVSRRDQLLAQQRMHSMISSVDVKSEIPLGLEQVRPLDLRTDIRMMAPMMDPLMQEKQLQQELILIQHQQQIQKQLLIAEFQKQHENLTRQHQAQIQEHIKLQKELLAIKHQQELLEKEQKLEQQRQEQELERHRREQRPPIKSRERSRERAVASPEVKQKLQEFLLSKSVAKDSLSNGKNHSTSRRPKLWHTAAHHTSLDQASPPLCGTSPSYKYTLPGAKDVKDDFPLRKTASEPNLKVRSKLKQKVTERRRSPLLRRKDGTVVCSFKKRLFEMTEPSVGSSSPGSGPSSPCNGPTRNTENETSVLPLNSQAEDMVPQHCILINEESMNLLNIYASPSLPNITLGLPAVQPALTVPSPFAEKQKNEMQLIKQGVAMSSQPRGTISSLSSPQPIVPEGKPNYSHQAILQHLLLKEKMRQQKLLPTGTGPLHSQSPLATNERISPNLRAAHKLPRHRPLNRTQSAPLPQSTLAQLVIQHQHQQFLEKQKQYQQQIHMNKILSKSIEQLKQPGSLEEAEEELQGEHLMQEEGTAPVDVSIRDDSSNISLHKLGQSFGAVKVKKEPKDSDDDIQNQQMESGEQSAFMQQQVLKQQQLQQLQVYQGQTAAIGMVHLDEHQPSARTQTSLTTCVLSHPTVDQPIPQTSMTGVAYDTLMLKHQCLCGNYTNHPEHAGRIQSIWSRLQECGLLNKCERIQGRKASLEEIQLVHSEHHSLLYGTSPLNRQKLDPRKILGSTPHKSFSLLPCGGLGVDSDTIWNELHSSGAARMAVGCVIELASKVVSGELKILIVPPEDEYQLKMTTKMPLHISCNFGKTKAVNSLDKREDEFSERKIEKRIVHADHHVTSPDFYLQNGFAIVRPPGHHAEESTAMGFCFFNSVAITAKYLRDKLNIGKILIVDLDVHHGNGTQQAFYSDPSILYVSLHRYDEGNFFPGSGAPNEVGSGPGEGYNINIAWTGGLDPPMGDVEYLTAFRTVIMPITSEFNPDFVLVSAGFDAVEGHEPPLGGYKVTTKCFGHLIKQLLTLAGGRMVLALEGGHDLTAICDASEACLNVLLGNELEPISEDILHQTPNVNAIVSLQKSTAIHRKYWKSVKPYIMPVSCKLAETQEREETEAVSAMALLSVDVEQSFLKGHGRAAGEPMEEESAL